MTTRAADLNLVELMDAAKARLAHWHRNTRPASAPSEPPPRLLTALVPLVMVALRVAASCSMVVAVGRAEAQACAPLHYWFNAAAAPPGVAADIDAAFRSISAVTGIDVVNERPGKRVVSARHGGVGIDFDGLGGPHDRRWLGHAVAHWEGRGPIVGFVRLNVAAAPADKAGPGGWRRVVMHELGHVLRVGHSADPADVMYPTVDSTAADWSASDVERLRRASTQLGCRPPANG